MRAKNVRNIWHDYELQHFEFHYVNDVTECLSGYDVIGVILVPRSIPVVIVVREEVWIDENVISRGHSVVMSANHYIPEIVLFSTHEHN